MPRGGRLAAQLAVHGLHPDDLAGRAELVKRELATGLRRVTIGTDRAGNDITVLGRVAERLIAELDRQPAGATVTEFIRVDFR